MMTRVATSCGGIEILVVGDSVCEAVVDEVIFVDAAFIVLMREACSESNV